MILSRAAKEGRKTAFDLVAVYRDMLVNIDSQAPNAIAHGYLKARFPQALVRREPPVAIPGWTSMYRTGNEPVRGGEGLHLWRRRAWPCSLMPHQEGVKHLESLMDCVEKGHQALALFIIQMRPVKAFSPHDRMHPAFGETLRKAAGAGVEIRAFDCLVTEQGLALGQPVPTIL